MKKTIKPKMDQKIKQIKQKLKIAIVYDAITEQFIGALESTMRFADKLQEKGHTVIFLAAKYPRLPRVDYFKGYKVYRFRSIMLPWSEKKFFISFPTRRELRKIFKEEKFDILHMMAPTPTAVVAAYVAKEFGTKIVAHSHTQPENITHNLPNVFHGKSLQKLFYRYIVWLYNKAEVVMCPSKFAENLLKEKNSEIETLVVSNGVDTSFFKKTSPIPFLKKYNLSKDKKRLLFVGRLHPEKNVKVLIKAMPEILSKMNNVELCIVGVGYMKDELNALAKKLGVEHAVKFLGRIETKDLPAAYSSCDIFVLPSLIELEGMVVLEAMACGKPILIADSPTSASPFFVSENGMKFNPQSPFDLAQKVLVMLSNSGKLEKMARNSLEIIKFYDIKKSVQTIEKIYKSL